MIPSQMEIQPGRGAIQLPLARGNATANHFIGFSGISPAQIGLIPDTPSVRIHFAASVAATATCAVADVFGAARFRALESYMLDSAIAALSAVQHHLFSHIFGKMQNGASRSGAIEPFTQPLIQGCKRGVGIKKKNVGQLKHAKLEPFPKRQLFRFPSVVVLHGNCFGGFRKSMESTWK